MTNAPRILVVGDMLLDHYLWGKCERISPEAPVQIVDIERETTVLGGAGNVISNLVALGAYVEVCGVVGDDNNGKELVNALSALGLSVAGILIDPDRKTAKKTRIVAADQHVIRYDSETKNPISLEVESLLLEKYKTAVEHADIILLSDYGKGVLTHAFTKRAISLAKDLGKQILVDPKGEDYSKYRYATLVTPNRHEASLATKIAITDDASLQQAGTLLKQTLQLDYVLITLSKDGIAIFSDDFIKMHTAAREVYDVTGAGDTVLASLGYAMALGRGIVDAVSFANSAAAVVVGKLGSATATLDEIEAYDNAGHIRLAETKLKNQDEIVEILKTKKDKKIIFSNGCFDLLHAGHVKYLQTAKSYGDILVVGINSDNSIKNLKGQRRPVNVLADRACVLAGLESVDYVVPFNESTPLDLVRAICPDVLVKGSDYANKTIVGAEFAKQVRLVQIIEGKSTSQIIEKVMTGC